MNSPTRLYVVLVAQPERNHETTRTYRASCYSEAFAMAEREDAGMQTCLYGVPSEWRDLARSEGLEFNDADGLLI